MKEASVTTGGRDSAASHQSPGKDLKCIFLPESVAIIGASASPEKIGHQILKNTIELGYTGQIYPIHPTLSSVCGLKAYPSILDVPGRVDLVVIAVPAQHVIPIFEQCAQKGVKGAAVITSGFAEVGNVTDEHRLKEIADRHNISLLGPNIFGVVYAPSKLNASFGPKDILPGRIAFITQSGALGIAMMGQTEMEKIGLAAVVSLGNKADIEEKEVIEYFNDDPNVDTILVYLEGLKSGRKFMTTEIRKPVVILKVGRSKRGSKAAASHTGSLAGSDKIYDAAFKQLGILRADSFTEAFGWSRALSLPKPKGEELVIITNGGGIGVRTTDECETVGLKLLDDPSWLEAKYRKTMPDFGSTRNPIDITGQTGAYGYQEATKISLAEDKVHGVIVLYCETVVTDPMDIANVVKTEYESSKRSKPVVVAMVGGTRSRDAIAFLNEHHIPAFSSVTEAVSSLKALYHWQSFGERTREEPSIAPVPAEALEIIEQVKSKGRNFVLEHEARRILELCGVASPRWHFAKNVHDAITHADGLYPLAMKIASPDIIHKTEVGGVALHIQDKTELTFKFNHMLKTVASKAPGARIEGINLVKMVTGIECIAGLSQDPQFGPAVMFGLGGVFVEMLKDVSFRIVPFGEQEAGRLLADIKGQEILNGFRGIEADKASLVKTLCAIQALALHVKEIDINPLIVNKDGSFAADARIII
ncbi:MAG: acetate--CoA ligase family protein [Candidatus Omnitrophota bacterium]|nr:acetate--CoA ligase family protein [Candidatus Omnitrophota bacterium]MDZ4242647.1 acetate--CoA ligase family protein [Candidatus Omnitrophota bacterium]